MTTPSSTRLTGPQIDRAAGVLLVTACGDALGAGYEFGPPLPEATPVGMVGGGGFGWAPGEWTDDTSMAVAIAEVAATGADLRSSQALDAIAVRWAAWASGAPDVGVQTRAVLSAAGRQPTGAKLAAAAAAHHSRTGRSGGNGSLMRTAPVALAYLDDPDGLVEAAHAVSALTHHDPEAGEACALWCLAIRHAVLHGDNDGLRLALDSLPADRSAVWSVRLDEAEAFPPAHFDRNGWVVQAMQAAWSAIVRTPVPDEDPAAGVFAAHTCGMPSSPRFGAGAIPTRWPRSRAGCSAPDGVPPQSRRPGAESFTGGPGCGLMTWCGWACSPLAADAATATAGRRPQCSTTPGTAVPQPSPNTPHDPGVRLGGVDVLRNLPDGVDAVVSLCRLGVDEVPAVGVDPGNHLEVWLIDRADPSANPHLDFVLHDAARAVADLRAEDRTVLVHCVQAQSRTPAVAALYSALSCGVPVGQALADLRRDLPDARPNAAFLGALGRLAGTGHEK